MIIGAHYNISRGNNTKNPEQNIVLVSIARRRTESKDDGDIEGRRKQKAPIHRVFVTPYLRHYTAAPYQCSSQPPRRRSRLIALMVVLTPKLALHNWLVAGRQHIQIGWPALYFGKRHRENCLPRSIHASRLSSSSHLQHPTSSCCPNQ
jgi:hypothetical protein